MAQRLMQIVDASGGWRSSPATLQLRRGSHVVRPSATDVPPELLELLSADLALGVASFRGIQWRFATAAVRGAALAAAEDGHDGPDDQAPEDDEPDATEKHPPTHSLM